MSNTVPSFFDYVEKQNNLVKETEEHWKRVSESIQVQIEATIRQLFSSGKVGTTPKGGSDEGINVMRFAEVWTENWNKTTQGRHVDGCYVNQEYIRLHIIKEIFPRIQEKWNEHNIPSGYKLQFKMENSRFARVYLE